MENAWTKASRSQIQKGKSKEVEEAGHEAGENEQEEPSKKEKIKRKREEGEKRE